MTHRIIHDGKNRDNWLRARDAGVGASEVPILFGCGYGDSAQLDLYARKIGADVPPIETSEGMEIGNDLQDAILRVVAKRAGVVDSYAPNVALYANPDYPHLVCTPDGILTSGEPIECKNICYQVDESEWDGTIPSKYQLQLQSQIAVLEAKRGLFGALIFGGRVVWTWLDRDDALIAEIQERVNTFWEHVKWLDPCAPNGTRSSRQAAVAVANTLPPKELFDGEIQPLVLECDRAKAEEEALKQQAKSAERRRKEAEDRIILAMGAANEAVTASGWVFKRTITKRKASVTKASESHGLKIIAPKEQVA